MKEKEPIDKRFQKRLKFNKKKKDKSNTKHSKYLRMTKSGLKNRLRNS